jgi:plastocyanin
LQNTTLVFFVFVPFLAHAADPVLFFSDITSGPKTGLGDGLGDGAIVTIWGCNLGSSQGSSQIYFKDSGDTSRIPAHVYYWENADVSGDSGPADLYTYHGMQTIAFSIPSASADGAGEIYVTVNNKNSNELVFTVRSGNIYYVKTTGSDSNPGTWSEPWLTMDYSSYQAPTSAGDIVYFCDGVQDVSSAGWIIRYIYGTEGSPFAFIAYPGASVTVQGTTSGVTNHNWSSHHVVISKISAASDGDGIHCFKFSRTIGCEITDVTCANGQGGAFVLPSRQEGSKYFGNYIHDFGGSCSSNQHHTTYFSVRAGTSGDATIEGFEFAWNYLKDNEARGGVHIYDEGQCGDYTTTVKVHDNVIENQTGPGIDVIDYCSVGYDTEGNFEIYNNLLIECGKDPNGSGFYAPSIILQGPRLLIDAKIYNNTVYGYGITPETSGQEAIRVRANDANAFGGTWEFKNNIIVDTRDIDYSNESYMKAPTASSNNLWYNGGDGNPASPPSWDTSPLTSAPSFVNPGAHDFRLQSDSPCKEKGTSTVSGVVTRDMDGIPRPQADKYDIGTYEFPIALEGREIHLSATSHDYGSVVVGNSSDWTLTISNQGTEALTVNSVVSGNPDFTVISPTFPQGVNAGTSIVVVVRFSPSAGGAISGNLTINSNDADEPSLNVSLSGTGIWQDTELPVAEAGADKTALAGVSVSFDGSGSSDNVGITSYQWDFDASDGIQEDARGVTASHTYSTAGTYTVTLTVDDAAGNGPVSDTLTVTVEESTGTITGTFGDATGSDYTGTCSDTYVNAGEGGSVNYSTDDLSLNTYTWPVDTVANRMVMKWHVSAIPSNATIHTAILSLYMHDFGGDDQYDVSVHKIVNHNPVISACTWNTYDGVNAWTGGANGGAQDMAGAENTNTLDKTSGYKSWTIRNMVQDWVINPSSNFGLMLDSDSTAASDSNRYFRPTESSNPDQRPKLVVTYSVGPDTTPPNDVSAFTATAGVGQVSLSWTNPTDSDFAGVMIRYRTDGTYPTNYTDGTAVPNGNGGKIPGLPSASGSYVHTGLDSNLTYYYSAFTYDTSGNYSDTAHASATPLPPSNNQAPVIGEFKAIPSSLNNPGETITFNVSATDPDGDSLTYTIRFGDGTANGSGSEVVHTYETEGTYTAEVTVDDGHGNTVGESLQITVDDVPPVKPTGVTVK